MTKSERILTALTGGVPDKVPFMFNTVMQNVQEGIVGHVIDVPTYNGLNNAGWLGSPDEHPEVIPCLTCVPEVAEKLNLDAFTIQILPPMFVKRTLRDGEACIAGGLIEDGDVFKKCRAAMPDPDDGGLLTGIEDMIKRCKGDFALGARLRLGISPTLLSVGMENLAAFMADEDETLDNVIEMYTNFTGRLARNLSEMDFDFFWCFDDLAFTSSMMVSPTFFREHFKKPVRRAAANMKKPFIFHSDGNYSPILDDIVEIGASGIHPIERSSMNSVWLAENYGKKLCMIGNVDIDHILQDATEDEVFEDVRSRIALFGPGGGYIISDSNSVPGWCSPKNVLAMARAVEKYRYIY